MSEQRRHGFSYAVWISRSDMPPAVQGLSGKCPMTLSVVSVRPATVSKGGFGAAVPCGFGMAGHSGFGAAVHSSHCFDVMGVMHSGSPAPPCRLAAGYRPRATTGRPRAFQQQRGFGLAGHSDLHTQSHRRKAAATYQMPHSR